MLRRQREAANGSYAQRSVLDVGVDRTSKHFELFSSSSRRHPAVFYDIDCFLLKTTLVNENVLLMRHLRTVLFVRAEKLLVVVIQDEKVLVVVIRGEKLLVVVILAKQNFRAPSTRSR